MNYYTNTTPYCAVTMHTNTHAHIHELDGPLDSPRGSH